MVGDSALWPFVPLSRTHQPIYTKPDQKHILTVCSNELAVMGLFRAQERVYHQPSALGLLNSHSCSENLFNTEILKSAEISMLFIYTTHIYVHNIYYTHIIYILYSTYEFVLVL